MEITVKLDEFLPLDDFKKLLEKYRDFRSCYRELKINSITGKKSQFEICELNPPIICGLEEQQLPTEEINFRLKDSAFSIMSMLFIVDHNLYVTKINLQINILNTPCGKILLNLLEIGHTVDFRVVKLNFSDIQEITGFQACTKSKS
jgi:hypothetical protein